MEPADSIRRLGFARWYERRLIEGHVWFATAFLCLVAVLACVEEFNVRGSALRQLGNAGMMLAAAAFCIYALARYLRILDETLRLGEQATCGSCGTYARFSLVSPSRVRCRKCGNEWRLIDGG
jgi:hypothetical protein